MKAKACNREIPIPNYLCRQIVSDISIVNRSVANVSMVTLC